MIEDFFGVLDSGEVVQYGTYDLDVAVGRLPVATEAEFASYIEKVKDYEKKGVMDYSDWRATLLHAADDAKNSGMNDVTKHTMYQENLVRAIDSVAAHKNERWNFRKVYLLDYTEDASGQKHEQQGSIVRFERMRLLFLPEAFRSCAN